MRIVPYTAAHRAAFRDLNLAWLREHFAVEPRDERDLGDPETYILGDGGFIFVAERDGTAVGTCALMRAHGAGGETYELAKMAVAEDARGYGIGRALAEAAIAHARALGASRVELFTNPRLAPAVHLYRQLGFREVPMTATPYGRAALKMACDLRPNGGEHDVPGAPAATGYAVSVRESANGTAVVLEPATHYAWGAGCDGWHLLQHPALSVIAERMPHGTAEVRHRHVVARQYFLVLAGELHVECDGARHVLRARQGLHIPPGVAHQVLNESGASADFVVISGPPSHGDRVAAPHPTDA
ncbi:hypothetical protein tb265_47070 [Gemmatimonadetes bacterium T265]|nr:hypothetical protein tb265_47070 [Gemmatimonadetes bacterium T265]